jgi:hypothetical protein
VDTTTRRTRRWTEDPHQHVPPDLAAALRALRTQRGRLGRALAAFRTAGWGVPALAVATGMKPDAVAQQIHRARRAGATTAAWLTIPAPALTAEQHPGQGLNLEPNWPLPLNAARHLRELHTLARQVRGNTPADHPSRLASCHLAEDIHHLLRQGYRKARITGALSVTYRAVDQILESHGFRAAPPSASSRRGHVHA